MPSDSKNSEVSLERVLHLLDGWRHLPAYQLERRADVLFALFLPEVLEKHFGKAINPLLIPEFPIKQKGVNSSNKVDFLALQSGDPPERAFLVELKTDMASRRDEQDQYLREAVEDGLKELVMGVITLCGATDQRKKYVHLLKLLSRVSLIEYVDALFPPTGREFSEALKTVRTEVEKREHWPCLEVVYVQPQAPSETIDFNEFANSIRDGEAGSIRRVFSCYLKKWATEVAGSPIPKERS